MKTVSVSGSTPCKKAVLMSMCWMSQFDEAARCSKEWKDSRCAVGAVVLS